MSEIPDYTHNMSLRISEVMDEIGVNEKIVMKRRKLMLLRESLHTFRQHFMDEDVNTYFFGSQTEGTTTIGLESDIDYLYAHTSYNVIQDICEWEQYKLNLLMIQDETVSPGYCSLQLLRDDAPLPEESSMSKHAIRDDRGRILIKNTMFNDEENDELEAHGPAQSEQGRPGFHDADYVAAFTCRSLPIQAKPWLDQHNEGCWPSKDTIQYCSNASCFLVGVGNKGSENEALEWRISTSLAERSLMFSLNITQIRCYVLMKFILKTFITPQYPNNISSYMCKTVLFHCAFNKRAEEWTESTLLPCLSFCLSKLYNFVSNENCPHFIIKENNLMVRRISQEVKPSILDVLQNLIDSSGRALLEIECDEFGQLLQHSLNGSLARHVPNASTSIAGDLYRDTALVLKGCVNLIIYEMKDLSTKNAVGMVKPIMSKIINMKHAHEDSKKLIVQNVCPTMGTILVPSNFVRRKELSNKALSFLSSGLDFDVASGKLKLASVLYSIGDFEMTDKLLKKIEKCYDQSVVEPICNCYFSEVAPTREKFDIMCYKSDQGHSLIKQITASCVQFLRCEINCCPFELRYEMFRSTQEDYIYRDDEVDEWMDTAVVDALPYLYFLQYKICSGSKRQGERRNALSHFVRVIDEEPNLGHRETALNLIGQCMEKENQIENAFKYYVLSLKLRGENNSAKIHICLLMDKVINYSKHEIILYERTPTIT